MSNKGRSTTSSLGLATLRLLRSLARTLFMDVGGGRDNRSIGVSARENRRIIVLL